MAGQGWGWFFVTSAIVYGSFMVLGCVVMIVYKYHSEKTQKQKFRAEVDYYAQFVGDYYIAVSEQEPEPKPCSLEVYSRTVWTPASATNTRDYRRNCGEGVSSAPYGDDQSITPSESSLASRSVTSWSIYDEDRQQFTSIPSTPLFVGNDAVAAAAAAAASSSPRRGSSPELSLSPRTSSPPEEYSSFHRMPQRPRLSISTAIWPRRTNAWDCTPSTATISPSSQEEGITPVSASGTEFSPATSIGSSFAGADEECAFDEDPLRRASFETVGLGGGGGGGWRRGDVDLEAYRCYDRSELDGEDLGEPGHQWHARMTKAVQSLFVKEPSQDAIAPQQEGIMAAQAYTQV